MGEIVWGREIGRYKLGELGGERQTGRYWEREVGRERLRKRDRLSEKQEEKERL